MSPKASTTGVLSLLAELSMFQLKVSLRLARRPYPPCEYGPNLDRDPSDEPEQLSTTHSPKPQPKHKPQPKRKPQPEPKTTQGLHRLTCLVWLCLT